MITKKLTIINKLGLHARAAMKLINAARRYHSHIQIKYQNSIIDAKDILQVMSLGVSQGKIIECIISGDDEQLAMQAITQLIANRFDEAE